jgi:hypothetical protein
MTHDPARLQAAGALAPWRSFVDALASGDPIAQDVSALAVHPLLALQLPSVVSCAVEPGSATREAMATLEVSEPHVAASALARMVTRVARRPWGFRIRSQHALDCLALGDLQGARTHQRWLHDHGFTAPSQLIELEAAYLVRDFAAFDDRVRALLGYLRGNAEVLRQLEHIKDKVATSWFVPARFQDWRRAPTDQLSFIEPSDTPVKPLARVNDIRRQWSKIPRSHLLLLANLLSALVDVTIAGHTSDPDEACVILRCARRRVLRPHFVTGAAPPLLLAELRALVSRLWLLALESSAPGRPGPALVFGPGCTTVSVEGRPRKTIAGRPMLLALARALVAAHVESPGQPVSIAALAARLWPGEGFGPHAKKRVHVLVHELRALLENPQWVRGTREGYTLEPNVHIAIEG